jgi:3-oxoacyl-[acyl-carrier-protein] synthase-1
MNQTAHAPVYLHAPGMINALGANLDAIAAALAKNASPGMGLIETQTGPAFAGRVHTPLEMAPPASLAIFDCRNNRLLLAALAQIASAIEAARERYGASRIGVVLGTSTSGIGEGEAAVRAFMQGGTLPENFDYRQMEFGTPASLAAAVFGLRGPAYTISTACTSSAKAIIAARRLLRAGLCDVVITGGVDSLCELTLQGFASLELTGTARTNPMSRNRSGINIGEGATVFLMSRADTAGCAGRRHHRPVMLAGAGESSDAYHVSSPDPEGVGAEIALRSALADAQLSPAQIAYVNLHATATRKNDEMEAHLMARVFPNGVPASGTKPLTGHTLGAAGATELGLAWLCLARDDVALPRHLWDGERDPALPVLDLVEDLRYLRHSNNSNSGRDRDCDCDRGNGSANANANANASTQYIMSNSFAFGGSNASLILGR